MGGLWHYLWTCSLHARLPRKLPPFFAGCAQAKLLHVYACSAQVTVCCVQGSPHAARRLFQVAHRVPQVARILSPRMLGVSRE